MLFMILMRTNTCKHISGAVGIVAHAKAVTDVHAIVGCIVAYGHYKITLTIELCTVNNLCYRPDSWLGVSSE